MQILSINLLTWTEEYREVFMAAILREQVTDKRFLL
jgi:hypothetical protein